MFTRKYLTEDSVSNQLEQLCDVSFVNMTSDGLVPRRRRSTSRFQYIAHQRCTKLSTDNFLLLSNAH